MARPNVLIAATKLYSPAEPEGRVFQAGETWPGDVWSEKPGGAPVGGATLQASLKDLVAASDANEGLSQQIVRMQHDLDVMAAQRDDANGKIEALEQRAIAAEQAATTAEEAAKGYMQERDQARADLQRLQAKAEKPAKAEA